MNNLELAIMSELQSLCYMIEDASQCVKENLVKIQELEKKVSTLPNSVTDVSCMKVRGDLIRTETLRHIANIFRNLNSLVICAGNISKMLWLSQKELIERGGLPKETAVKVNTLYDNLKIKLKRETLKSFHFEERDLRDYIEHYNRHLLSVASQTGNVSSYTIKHSKSVDQNPHGVTSNEMMRVYVWDKHEYIIRGDSFSIRQIESDARQLLVSLQENDPFKISF